MRFALMLSMLLWNTWHTATLDRSELRVDDKPYFVYGAAFFYERTPRAQWESDLRGYKQLGINTIDLYVMWNWHEPQPNTIDFDGQTNPQRDLRDLMRIIDRLGFHVIIRPGPVIRNEWRNGGYPDYLLQRAAYAMPLHDVLEGRYPATATLQNAHADAAAQEWLENPEHLRAASAWLRAALQAIAPWSHDVIAIALDDDQGAYIDNDTWPAPHWHHYIEWLRDTVRGIVGERVPLFINTYQMKVTASAPVWAWGNWYQSDAYRIGDHDIAQLAFSTALLQTQPDVPTMVSEFQAGWLQGADQTQPRPASPQNTSIALHEMLQFGTHGVVNFPVADTRNPAGYEAPWANRLYAWDSAYALDGSLSARAQPTATFGTLVARNMPWIATLRPRADVAIAWMPSAYDATTMSNARIAAFAANAISALQACRAAALTCRFVDLRYDTMPDLLRTTTLVVAPDHVTHMVPAIATRLATLAQSGISIVGSVADAHITTPSAGGLHDAAVLVAPDERSALYDIFNAGTTDEAVGPASLHIGGATYTIPATTLAAGDAADFRLDANGVHRLDDRVTLRDLPAPAIPAFPNASVDGVYSFDVYDDQTPTFVLQNRYVRAVVSADAGARIFMLVNRSTGTNVATSIGLARDDVQDPPNPSSRDYIAAYTHPIRAGTFNRHYRCTIEVRTEAALLCTYTAPDLAATPVTFTKEFVLAPDATALVMRVRSTVAASSIENASTTFDYAANQDEYIRFPLQGPPVEGANPAPSP